MRTAARRASEETPSAGEQLIAGVAGAIPMVNPGGTNTMLGQWRMILKQAEESAKLGRFDEALNLATRPDVADHRQAVLLRSRMAVQLVGRGERRAEADDTAGAITDLDLAEKFGAAPDAVAAARQKVAERLIDEVRADLEAGEPGKVAERVTFLAEHRVSNAALRRFREAAEAWRKAQDDARRGEFGQAIDGLERAGRLAGEVASGEISAAIRDLSNRRETSQPRIERLYAALASTSWSETLAAAESVLDLVPEHPAAKQARQRAWQQIGALSPSAALPGRVSPPVRVAVSEEPAPVAASVGKSGILFIDSAPRPSNLAEMPTVPWRPSALRRDSPASGGNRARPEANSSAGRGRFLLWADAVGGYLVILDSEIILGRAGVDSPADVPLLGDLSRKHATLVRDGDGYVLKAHQPCFVNGRKVEVAPLRNGDVIRLGSTVELEFRQPSPVSSTARLEIVSRHRLPLAVDGVILMAETCIVGPSAQAHVPAPNLDAPVVLYRQGGGVWCRASGEFEVDGSLATGRAPLTLKSQVRGEGFSFSLEPVEPKTSMS